MADGEWLMWEGSPERDLGYVERWTPDPGRSTLDAGLSPPRPKARLLAANKVYTPRRS